MDFQPVNLFIRGAASAGGLVTLSDPMTVYKYLCPTFHQSIIDDPNQANQLPPPIYVTHYRYYKYQEALRALALPGPPPTHVLEIDLAPGAELQGPAFVQPLPPSQVLSLPREHRYGNGIEFMILTPLSGPYLQGPSALRVVPL